MARYLVLAPADGVGDESLLEELGRLAAREPSYFHVVVPRRPGGAAAPEAAAGRRLVALLDAVTARGFDADGEVGEASVVGSVARATERAHYDAVVVPLPAIGVVEVLDLEVARRLHQIDVPLLDLVTPGRRVGAGAPPLRPPSRPVERRSLLVGGLLVLVLAFLVAVLESSEAAHHASLTAGRVTTLRMAQRAQATVWDCCRPLREAGVAHGGRAVEGDPRHVLPREARRTVVIVPHST